MDSLTLSTLQAEALYHEARATDFYRTAGRIGDSDIAKNTRSYAIHHAAKAREARAAIEKLGAELTETAYGTFTFNHHGTAIHDPTYDDGGIMRRVSPDFYGFHVCDTGGGCTAWRRDFTLHGEPVYMLVTAIDEASHEIGPEDAIGLGVYVDDGWTAYVIWTQGEGSLEDTPPKNITTEGEMRRVGWTA